MELYNTNDEWNKQDKNLEYLFELEKSFTVGYKMGQYNSCLKDCRMYLAVVADRMKQKKIVATTDGKEKKIVLNCYDTDDFKEIHVKIQETERKLIKMPKAVDAVSQQSKRRMQKQVEEEVYMIWLMVRQQATKLHFNSPKKNDPTNAWAEG
jgi:hypothetical protein